MWVFTTDGFLSAVEERRGDHRGEIVVRAREASALEALREIAPTLTPTVIYGDSDYRYRAWLGREEWAEALAEIGRRVVYDNFKSEVLRRQGRVALRGGVAHGVVDAGADAAGRPLRVGRRRLPAGAGGRGRAAPCVRQG